MIKKYSYKAFKAMDISSAVDFFNKIAGACIDASNFKNADDLRDGYDTVMGNISDLLKFDVLAKDQISQSINDNKLKSIFEKTYDDCLTIANQISVIMQKGKGNILNRVFSGMFFERKFAALKSLFENMAVKIDTLIETLKQIKISQMSGSSTISGYDNTSIAVKTIIALYKDTARYLDVAIGLLNPNIEAQDNKKIRATVKVIAKTIASYLARLQKLAVGQNIGNLNRFVSIDDASQEYQQLIQNGEAYLNNENETALNIFVDGLKDMSDYMHNLSMIKISS